MGENYRHSMTDVNQTRGRGGQAEPKCRLLTTREEHRSAQDEIFAGDRFNSAASQRPMPRNHGFEPCYLQPQNWNHLDPPNDFGLQPPPERCPKCGMGQVRYQGLGTEKLQAEIESKFPQYTVQRMDSDTMRRPGSHQRTLDAFRRGEIKILLGTQMIAKGLDFPNVTLVGVINADLGLHVPDFRASERRVQLLFVSGACRRVDRDAVAKIKRDNR